MASGDLASRPRRESITGSYSSWYGVEEWTSLVSPFVGIVNISVQEALASLAR